MKPKQLAILGLVFVLGAAVAAPATAQQHRATRLGDPATRFAPPLKTPDDLRALLRDERWRADVLSILRQSGWRGDFEDFQRAAATADITPISIPPGTRLTAMSSRHDGVPILLKDVLWAGSDPIDAYEFRFTSKDRPYRVVTPKACSNFWIEPLDAEALPGLEAVKSAPAEATVCAPFETRISLRNAGRRTLNEVRVTDTLPAGWKTTDDRTSLSWEVGRLDPAAGREFRFFVVAPVPGTFTNTIQVSSSDGGQLEVPALTVVRAPALALECAAPPRVFAGRPAEVCLTIRNAGDAAESNVVVSLPLPGGAALAGITEAGTESGGRIAWAIDALPAQASRKLCASFTLPDPGALSFRAEARGTCAAMVESDCVTRVVGVPGILVEVVDVEDPIEVGKPVTYNIRVTNQGSIAGTNLKVVCTLADGQEFIEGSGASAVQAQGRTVTLAPLPTLGPKDSALWQVVVRATQAGDARFKTDVTSDQFQQPVEEYEATQQY